MKISNLMAAAIVIFIGTGVETVTGAETSDASASSPSPSPSPHASPVGMTVHPYIDPARLNWSHTGPRPLNTVIWYPAPEGMPATPLPLTGKTAIYFGDARSAPFFAPIPIVFDAPLASGPRRPLILLSHGSTGLGLSLEWLAQSLAARGYVVAAVNHHGNTIAEGQLVPQGFGLPWERADDLSAVLTALLGDPVFGPAIDSHRIGAAGHSAGGETVIALAGGRFDRPRLMAYCASAASRGDATCEPRDVIRQSIADIAVLDRTDPAVHASLQRARRSHRDPRIRAVFAMAPAMGPAFAASDLASIHIPVAIVVGDTDETAPSRTNAARFARLIPGATLTELAGVGHLTFSSACTPAGLAALPSCHDRAGVDRGMVQNETADLAYRFFQSAWRQAQGKTSRFDGG
jgi:predicted dienelactone hydrolase